MIRFAVIGTNFITERLLRAAAFCPDFTLAAVYSRTRERAEEFAQAFGAPLCFTSLDELAVSPQVDAVYLASPNACHMAQAVTLLRAGKHVLCEKPMASNADEVRAMLNAAQEGGAVLLEAVRAVFSPGIAAVRAALPRIGPVRRATLSYCQYSSRYDAFRNGDIANAFNPALSNSALMDIGVYCAHFLVSLFGAPESVAASSLKLDNGFEGLGTIVASYPGMIAELVYSKITNSCRPSEIQGENGCLLLDRVACPQRVTLCGRDGTQETLPIEPEEHDMRYELAEFIACIAQPERALPFQRASLETALLMEEARRQTGVVFPADSK